MNKLVTITFIITLPLISTACSTTPDIENPILHHSENSRELGNTWDEGNEQVKEGNELITEGKALIEEGEEKLEKGLGMVEQGTAKMKSSETAFEKLLNK